MSLGDDHDGRTSEGFGGSGQTRTRLPGSAEADVYGGARRPVRSSRSLIGVVGVVVLLIAAIAFANRGSGEDGTAKGNASNPEAAPTAATGVRPVKSRTGDIPTGYAQDEQGAQSAAANYAVALGSTEMFDKASRDAIVSVVYSPDVAAERRGDLDRVYSDKDFLKRLGLTAEGTAPTGMTFVSRSNPAGAKVESFATDTARVSVWYSTLFGLAGEGSTNPVTEGWYTNTFSLEWVDGDWKVTDFTQKDGPVPVGRDQAASGAEEMSEAVKQFGGFTYAR
ncbi:hypothetical protein NPS70_12695 [Streptomyces sp. C10-9-1]|uniref:hypothetical protein n=1 Tax=Streptomyces sp. C10-9-1 TaxID=1859285 RepID=UPI0021115D1E|nr:hypothetical protein [Streptomyces sp. C10-9-1]MCQ6554051.1 hypothetical protein [Streptomyces sp. C10-9-1]